MYILRVCFDFQLRVSLVLDQKSIGLCSVVELPERQSKAVTKSPSGKTRDEWIRQVSV